MNVPIDVKTTNGEELINKIFNKFDIIQSRLDIIENKINKLSYLICDSPKNKQDTTFVDTKKKECFVEIIETNQPVIENKVEKKPKSKRTRKKTNFDYNIEEQKKLDDKIISILGLSNSKISRYDFKESLLKYLNYQLVFTEKQINELNIDAYVFEKLGLCQNEIINYDKFEEIVTDMFKTL